MSSKVVTYKNYRLLPNNRIDFSKISGSTPLPNLVEVQTKSFKEFLEKGLDEVFKECFPIENYSGTAEIIYESFRFEEPEYSPLECKEGDLTYSAKLKCKLGLRIKASGEISESEVFMGDIPMMTDSGTFIVNGAERVIVSQIGRSPGAYFQDNVDKSGVHLYAGEIIPTRGTWLQFESDLHGLMWVRIDRQKKMPATTLFKALGITSEEDLITLFGDSESLQGTLAKNKDISSATDALVDIFRKLKPGEPITQDGIINFLVQKFFDDKRYDLGRAGRFKYTQKLGIYNRLKNRVLAEPLVSKDGDIFTSKAGIPFLEGHHLTEEDVEELRDAEFFENGAHEIELSTNDNIDNHSRVTLVKVHAFDKEEGQIVPIVGTDINLNGAHDGTVAVSRVTISDMVACFSYFNNLQFGIGDTDDIDHLGNRRVRCVGELLQTQFRIGLTKMSKTVQQKMSIMPDLQNSKPNALINIRQLTKAIRDFFASSQLSQFMDQTNPLAELSNKRRISALGPGGLTRDRASMEVRDVHYTHYGRICPIETPEGQNIGLISNLATYARIDSRGFIETPYRLVFHKKDENGTEHYYVSDKATYLSADNEREHYIAEANLALGAPQTIDFNDGSGPIEVKEIIADEVVARHDEDNVVIPASLVEYVDVSPKQIVSIATACIPFLENDDCHRALMGANMQRQALPLLRPALSYVGTGLEGVIARDSGLAVCAVKDGTVIYQDSATIKVQEEDGYERTYRLQKFDRSNNGTCINQNPIVKEGDKVKEGEVIADGPAMKNGELALGQNVLVAYMTWNGYNYEDAVIMSERMVKDDVYTSIHIEAHDIDCRETKLGTEQITRDIPNVGEESKTYLDESGIIIPGAEVREGDILVGKVTPKGQSDPSPEEKLLMAIFAEKTRDMKDSSLRVPHGGAGIVLKVKIYTREHKDPLPPGVVMKVRVYIVQKRKISEGDKMSGRHGNKGVISKILPVEDMPYLPDGTPIDVMLSPMGVPSRMNIGQILEIHLGLACHKLGMRVATPVFDGVSNEELFDIMEKAGLSSDGKAVLYDGRTGDRYDERISVGIMYMIKLVHMVDDKLHARATGPYSLVTQQPLGGKAQNGGQRFGEMEVWALEAYGAAHTLQEMLTIKSDDRIGRRQAYKAIIEEKSIPKAGMPEAFKVFVKELKGLAMNVHLYDQNKSEINLDTLAKDALIDERNTEMSIRRIGSRSLEDEETSTLEQESVIASAIEDEELSVKESADAE